MLVTIKAAKGRHVFVGEAPLSDKVWSSHPISASIVKAIKEGDIIEATQDQIEAAVAKDIVPEAAAEESPKAIEGKPVRK